MAMLVGYCLIAIIFAVIAYKNAKKGKKYSTLLTVGLVLYAMAFFGNLVGNKDSLSMIGSLISIVLIAVMFSVCKKQSRRE